MRPDYFLPTEPFKDGLGEFGPGNITVVIYNLKLDISDLYKKDACNCYVLGKDLKKKPCKLYRKQLSAGHLFKFSTSGRSACSMAALVHNRKG